MNTEVEGQLTLDCYSLGGESMISMICQPKSLHTLPLEFRYVDISLEGKNDFRNQDNTSNMYQMTRKILQKSEKC